jgi:putative MATE family efflux protein
LAVDSAVGVRQEGEEDPAQDGMFPLAVSPTEPETSSTLHRAVWRLAWPLVLTMLLQTFNSFLDRGFVGHLGSNALAAVGLGGQFMFLLFSVGMSISVGTSALVSRFAGAREEGQAAIAAQQSVWIGLAAGVACAALTWPLRQTYLGWMHVSPEATALSVQYLSLTILGIPALFLMLILSSVFRGLGDTKTPLLVMLGVNFVHLGGDWLLIFGHWGLPRLGIAGGAVALIASQVVGAALYFWALRRLPLGVRMYWLRPLDWGWVTRVLNIGLPAAAQNVSRVLSMMAFTGVLARSYEATAAVAALTIGLTSESIAFMPGFAFSMAASTLTGQNLGAGDPDRAERAAIASFWQGLAVMVVMGAVFFVFAVPFAHIFTHDPHVVPLAVAYLRIAAISEPFLALGMILTGALNGAGDTKAPAWAGLVTMWGVRLPGAWLAISVLHDGAIGAWWAMTASTILSGLAALALFRWGRWKRTVV